MNCQDDYPNQTITDMEWRKCHVQEWLATKRKYCSFFPNFSPVIYRPVPHYFFTSLKRIAFSWSIIQPFGRIKNEVSLFNNLTSIAMNETRFLPWSTSPSLFCDLTSLTTVIARSFFMFRESEKEDERELHNELFRKFVSQIRKSIK